MSEVECSFRDGVGLALVQARRGVGAVEIGERLGFAVPREPGLAAHGPLALIGIGPDSWLAVQDQPAASWPDDLCAKLAGVASVFDQSAGYRIVRISGPAARAMLQSGCAIDLDQRIFGQGSSAATVVAHIGVILWQVDETPLFELSFDRSFSASMMHWVEMAAQAFSSSRAAVGSLGA